MTHAHLIIRRLAIVLTLSFHEYPAIAQLGQFNGQLQLTPSTTVRLDLALGTVGPAIEVMHSGVAGTITSKTYDALHYPHGFPFEHLWIGADQLAFDTSMVGRQGVYGQEIDFNFGGGEAIGTRAAQGLFATLQAPMSPLDANNWYGALWAFTRTGVSNGGTAATPQGNIYAINSQCQLGADATYYSIIECNETDVEVDAGASVAYKFGENITTVGADAVHGSIREAALHIGAVPSSGGWNYGIMFSDYSGAGVPVSTTGTIIGTMGNVGTVAKGIDFSGFIFTGNSISVPGMSVGPTGTLTVHSVIANVSHTPATSSEVCTVGQQDWDANYEYRCVATNMWKRSALSSW